MSQQLSPPAAGLQAIADWPVDHAAAGWTTHNMTGALTGDADRPFRLASITKALFALCTLVAVEEGSLALDQPAGPPGATISHLLSHSSGLAPERTATGAEMPVLGAVGSRRIYSNLGFELLGEVLFQQTGIEPAAYFNEAIVQPLGLTNTALKGSPAHGATSSVNDLLAVGRELLAPTLISPQTLLTATTPFLPDLGGVLPGFGRHDPNPWGLGFELRGHKHPHWTSPDNSPTTYGHFGAAGTFLWVDPDRAVACVVLTNRPFDTWALERWPELSNAVLIASEAG